MTWVIYAEESRVLYVDLDGVLANYDEAFKQRSGFTPEEYNQHKELPPFWSILQNDPGYWEGMDWLPGAESFWNSITQYNPTILSGPLRDEGSKTGKRAWVAKHLGENVPVILKSFKAAYAKPGAVLVDDMTRNIEPWIKAGGVGILHAGDYATTLQKVQEAMSGKPITPEAKICYNPAMGWVRTAADAASEERWRHIIKVFQSLMDHLVSDHGIKPESVPKSMALIQGMKQAYDEGDRQGFGGHLQGFAVWGNGLNEATGCGFIQDAIEDIASELAELSGGIIQKLPTLEHALPPNPDRQPIKGYGSWTTKS